MQESEIIDLREIRNALRRDRRWLAGGGIAGLLLAALLVWWMPLRYEATTTVLLKGYSGGIGGLGGGGEDGAISLGGLASILSMNSSLETEMEILSSRTLLGEVVDSLGLQAEVVEPRAMSVAALFAETHFPRELSEQVQYEFERTGAGYRVSGPGAPEEAVAPGSVARLGTGWARLRAEGLPDRFAIEVSDYSTTVDEMEKALSVDQAAGDVAEVVFHSHDPVTAAAVPNLLVAEYLVQRKTTDRGTNQRRSEFLQSNIDTIAGRLSEATAALREHQERSGLLDPPTRVSAEVQQQMRLRARAEELGVDTRALEQVMQQAALGKLNAREVASYPSLLTNPEIN
ncbi:MAG TPA: Wzz/FepE/Etk N-terminal domain-containing protein, partial [Longimicrobiaceae bacterium]|nr:Wzz/FepE/Etk N-terminal domain-containing protein [Longimicrobiaceae bacterium]